MHHFSNDCLVYSTNAAHVAKIQAALLKNGGFCPCSLSKSEDTVCPCKDFRTTGRCHCGLYQDFTLDNKEDKTL